MADPVEIVITDDGMQAAVKQVTPKTSVEEVMAALKAAGVTHGISGESIQNAVSTAQKSNRPIGDIVVARGTPPKAALPPRIETPDDGPALAQLGPVAKALESESASDLAESVPGITVRTVLPGETLGTLVVEPGEPGTTVRGEKTTDDADAGAGKSPADPGPGVSKNDSVFTSTVFGCAGLLDGQAAVVPPVWVTEDGMTAAYVAFPREPGSAPPDREALEAALKEAGVTFGIDEEALDKLVEALGRDAKLKPLIPVARGEGPVEAVDAAPEFSFPYLTQSGLVQESGSIDLRERNSFPGVAQGELLVEGKAGEPGKPGHTVRGEEIDVSPPREVELVAGENVRVEGSPPTQRLIAELEGGASCSSAEITADGVEKTQFTVAVRPVAQISGDVDYETGNLDFKGNVEVKGSVKSGFRVRATGDIRIGETVESGAEIVGSANLVVKLGIVGENTVVKTEGNVTAKFIQDATVSAGGNIAVGSYIRSANVSSGGTITVEGSGGAVGGILGGEVWASEAIVSKNVGSEHAYTTTICLGLDREAYEQYVRVSKMAGKARDQHHSLMKAIGITKLDTEEIRKAIIAQPRRKHEILRYVQKANDLAKIEAERDKESKDLAGQLSRSASNARLDVPDTAYPKVTVRIGERERTLDQGLKGVRFSLDAKEGIVARDLSGDGDGEDEGSAE